MEQVLFGDVFANIEPYLFPIDLHNLLLSCKRYNKMISINDIKKNAIIGIKKLLRENLDDNYDEFVEVMQKTGATIVGNFITQYLCGDILDYVNILIKNNDNMIVEFMVNKKYSGRQGIGTFINNWRQQTRMTTMQYFIKNIELNICSLSESISNETFVHNYIGYAGNKNTYKFATNELHINRIEEIFAKVTTISTSKPLSLLSRSFAEFHERGFRFYFPDNPTKLITNDEIFHSYFNIMKVKEKNYREQINGRFVIENNSICTIDAHSNVFDIIDVSFYEEQDETYTSLYIQKCAFPQKKCVIQTLFPKMNHYHGRYVSNNIFDDDIDKGVILLIENE
uniref:Uncharacterized protein n=1 Tax=viral metagenome TaxID=1070528 RepID=A0A6C0C710_9ZZZZ